ncbi:MAG: CAP domain-containing protein [Candidatus Paceibacterota bacterium]
MKRYSIYILIAAALVFIQVQFGVFGDVARIFIGAPHVLTDIRISDNIGEARDATIERIERVLVPKEPLFVSSDGDISGTELTVSGIIIESNIERALNAQLSLKENPTLSQAAYNKARDILDERYFAHVSPDGRGPSDVVEAVGYDYILVGENLAMGVFENDRDLVEAWMNSPGHRANILHEKFSEIGVGVARGVYDGREVWVAVQEFGLPKSACPQVNGRLSQEIGGNQVQLEIWEEQLLALRQDVEEDRNQENVEAYNSLVDDFNDLVEETERDIEEYNKNVRAYNACVNG